MHPVIRIVNLMVLAAALAMSQLYGVLLGITLVALMYTVYAQCRWTQAWPMLRRMRWLFLSILVVYFWFTPGTPIIEGAGEWSVTVQGIEQGMARVLALVTLVLAVNLMLQTTRRAQLMAALLWLTYPLRHLGWPHERFAVRMSLVLETVGEVQTLYKATAAAPPEDRKYRLSDLGARLAQLFAQTLARAAAAPLHAVHLEPLLRPPWYQWLYPAAIFAVLWGARVVEMARL